MYPPLAIELYGRPNPTIEQLIVQQKHSGLRLIVLLRATSKLAQSIFNGEYPYLKVCHLGRCQRICLPSKANVKLQVLLQLTIQGQHGRELEKLLSICPLLISFDFFCNDTIPQMTLKNHYFPSMKSFRLSRITKFRFHTGQFEQLLSIFPNLIQFHLIVDQCTTSNETIDLAKIANYFHQQLQRLKILDLRIYMTQFMRYSVYRPQFVVYADLHPLFKYFYKCDSLLTITSYDLNPYYSGSQKYVRPS